MTLDLFTQRTGPETRLEARESVDAADLRRRAFAVLMRNPAGLTADEVAAEVGVTPLAMRPRITELKQAGDIYETGERRRNHSGRSAAVVAVRR